jgi:hypothetical protein
MKEIAYEHARPEKLVLYGKIYVDSVKMCQVAKYTICHTSMVCVFPLDVWPYANIVPL